MEIDNKKVKEAKIEWYSRKKCVQNYYSDRFSTPLGYYWCNIEKKIVLKHVKGYVLDAGTGPGRFAIPVADKGHKVMGIDISLEMLKHAKEKSVGREISYIQADLEYLPFKSNTFDSVVSIHVLRHLPQYQSIIKEFLRVVRPNGTIIFEMPSGDYMKFTKGIAKLLGKIPKKEKVPLVRDYENKVSFSEINKFLNNSGVEVVFRYTYDFFRSFVFNNSLINLQKKINKLLSERWFFKFCCYLELNILKCLPTFLSLHYMTIARKNKSR